MNKKYQSKLEDIENEVDSFKKKRGRPAGSKNKKSPIEKDMDKLNKINKEISKASHKLLALYPAKGYIEKKVAKIDWNAEWDNIEVPTLRKLPESKVPLTAKITLVAMVFIIGVLLLA